MNPTVYLAGPINGCTEGQAKEWRKYVADELALSGIRAISPLRCEPIVGERYKANYADPKFGVARAIRAKNVFDVRSCTLTFAYLPRPMAGVTHQSYGTIIEIGWAHITGKPVILVSDDPEVIDHPVINASSDWVLRNLYEGIDVAVGILAGYVDGGNNV